MRGCCFLVNSGLGRYGQGTVDVQDAPEKRVVRGQAGVQGQGAFRAVGADLRLQFHALSVLRTVKAEGGSGTAAMLGAMAARIPPKETAARMAGSGLEPVRPDEAHREAYETIYRRWKRYHDCLAHVEK